MLIGGDLSPPVEKAFLAGGDVTLRLKENCSIFVLIILRFLKNSLAVRIGDDKVDDSIIMIGAFFRLLFQKVATR